MEAGNGRNSGVKMNAAGQRAHNRSLVLTELFYGGSTSRSDLARSTSLTKVAVSDLVEELISAGLVAELGLQRGGVGKPSTIVGFDAESRQIVVVDLGSTGVIRGAITNLDGRILVTRTKKVADKRGNAMVEVLKKFVQQLMAELGAPLLGVGIASPGIIDPSGLVIAAPHYGWFELPLRQMMQQQLGVPVVVINDADAAAIGEKSFGGAPDSMMMLSIRNGVGAGLIVDGAPVFGSRSAAGEMGHLTVDFSKNAKLCKCGRQGCLETEVSEPALTELVEKPGTSQQPALASAGVRLGQALAPVVAALNLTEVRLSGKHSLLAGPFIDAVEKTIVDSVMPASAEGFQVNLASGGDDIVLKGAAAYVLRTQLGIS